MGRLAISYKFRLCLREATQTKLNPFLFDSSASFEQCEMMGSSPEKAELVEVDLISAQQLSSCKSTHMQTYVRAWINPQNKLISRVDSIGKANPTWNDKFIFSIDEDIKSELENPNSGSAMVFEIYRVRHLRKDKCIGVVRILLQSLMARNEGGFEEIDGKFMAFQVRTPQGEPQGILNVGVTRLNGSFLGSSLAVDYRKLMGQERQFLQNRVSAAVRAF